MNRTSASVNRMPARSEASAAEMVRLGSPGAPGWTMGGCACVDAAPSDRNAMPAARTAARSGNERVCRVMGCLRQPGGRPVFPEAHILTAAGEPATGRGRLDARGTPRPVRRAPAAAGPWGTATGSHGSGRHMPGRRFVRVVSADPPVPGGRGSGPRPLRSSPCSRAPIAAIGGTRRRPARARSLTTVCASGLVRGMAPLKPAAAVAAALLLLAALAATSVVPHAHGHDAEGAADCDACHFRHLSVIETDRAPASSAPDLVAHAAPSAHPQGEHGPAVVIRPTRGPPA